MRNFIANLIFVIHFIFVFFWLGLFFVPESLLENKVYFHFYLTLLVVGHQFLWGFIILPWTEKYRMVCFLTTFTQFLRGQKISDPKNYEHSFTREILGGMGINISHRTSTFLALFILTVVSIQYFF